jgi:hypothetical protein
MRVADGNGECIRGIGTPEGHTGKQVAHHGLHLFLGGVTIADDGAFYLHGAIFGDWQASQAWCEHDDAARLAEFQSAFGIARDIGVFHRRFIGLEIGEGFREALMQD